VTIARDAVAPRGPNRTAAQRRNGNGRYISAGAWASMPAGQVKTRTVVRSRPAPSTPASMLRPRGRVQTVGGKGSRARIAGARVGWPKASVRNHERKIIQCAWAGAARDDTNDETKGATTTTIR